MKNKAFIGIDVSKNVLYVYILKLDFHCTVFNSPKGFANLLEICCTKLACKPGDIFFCFENTGRYSRHLAVFLSEADIPFAMVSALDIKQSRGLKRGKSDIKDAKIIALYAWRKEMRSSLLKCTVQKLDNLDNSLP